jgi:hypothetical protein
VPPAELLRQVEKRFTKARTRAAHALRRLERPSGDERIYQLTSREQVFERARAMLRLARVSALCDLFPRMVDELAEDMRTASRRGVHVCAHVYRPARIGAGVQAFLSPAGDRLLERWPGQWLNVVVDAQQSLLVLLDATASRVVQAISTESAYLSVMYFSALSVEMMFGRTTDLLDRGADPARVRAECARLRRSFEDGVAPGYSTLLAKMSCYDRNQPTTARRRRPLE